LGVSVPEVVLEIPASPRYLHLVRSVVAATASVDARIAPQRVADLRVVVSEAATNAVRAQERSGSHDGVLVRCRLDDERLEVEVSDRGSGFDEQTLPVLPAVETPDRLQHESGLGVPLMRILTDEVEIRSGADGTSVRLAVRIPGSGPSPDRTGPAGR
jgi:serine/threonine-protein kinase RsbW